MASTDENRIRLIYFNGRSRCEPIRYLFAYAQIPYEDRRIELGEWLPLKPTFPLTQLPVVELLDNDGSVVARQNQSGALLRVYAAKFGVAGSSSEECALADQFYECARDLFQAVDRIFEISDPTEKEKAVENLKNSKSHDILGFCEKHLAKNGGKHIAGGKDFTYADFAIACLLDYIADECVVGVGPATFTRPIVINNDEIKATYPGLWALKCAVEKAPGIKTYLATRQKTAF